MRFETKTAILALAGAGALMLTACVPPNVRQGSPAVRMKVVDRLDCPARQGGLVRSSAAGDGKSCIYADGDEVQVQLKLIPINVDAQTTLQPIEDDLRKLAPIDEDSDRDEDAEASPTPDRPAGAPAMPPTPPNPGRRDEVNINLPGVHIRAGDEKANIQVGGINVDADDRSAHIRGAPGHHGDVSIDASDRGAIVRSTSRGPDVRQTLMLASDRPGPDGWRAVGYEAHGPRTGPLVVAVVQSKAHEHDTLFEEVKALVQRNSGG